ncbi:MULTISPECIES: tRNA (guanosine(46)-N7)-methyltransferase TrmB [Arsenophonus]|jgi:tRNA (guanine-N7-)-methyltransferase|uniref:tRNA (guanosine(46)-N7)-methyltransferase TrmB n=1 Tax=Arsenophonus TaxID=637 RepID=UPI0015D7F0B1|nr:MULTISPECIES: tRNA (guanosine(46)-N7)-methyltransferase TrmB [Arsenophonus]UBX29606.1 tRNA (guanosine(46)-N7)-methyltransferase TrmB [Arsenophonus apicola]
MMKNVITPEVNDEGKVMRRVRSFVRRQGRLTPRQENALQMLWPKMGVDFTGQPLLFNSLFGNNAPVILEIGFGMGASLVTMAEQNPAKNFLGIEVHAPGIGACLAAANEANLSNLRVMCHDAIEVLEKMLPDDSLNMVQLFFPDPWHKVRHNKRRIVQQPFAELVLHKLELGGIFHMATDWQPYAEHMLNVMREISNYRNLSVAGDYVERPASRPVTKFEKRGQQLGHGVFDLMFERIK